MKLSTLIQDLPVEKIQGSIEIEINGLSQNSKSVEPGNLFVCIVGFVTDGHYYIPEAINRGAKVILLQKDLPINSDITTILVKDTRKALAFLANRYYHYPSRKLKLIGITGTNGKTTVAYMIKAILEEAQKKIGLLTTVENIINNQTVHSRMTTMESLDLQKTFCQMLSYQTDYAIMEVSSHALSLSRVEGCDFDIAIFTNISDEHFEIHKNFANYLESKKRLFLSLNESCKDISSKKGIINIDEKYAHKFMDCLKTDVLTYGIKKQKSMFHARNIVLHLKEIHFTAETPQGEVDILLNMSGIYNVYNALAAIAAATSQGIPLDIIASAFRKFSGAPGRYKILDYGQPYTIIVDFAHNFHGLEHILKTLRLFSRNKIITIFGHGGERDNRVRKKMGQVVGKYSDYSIITADNPRSENPAIISKEIESGFQEVENGNYRVILDRVKAINFALQMAEENDIVLIAGKGPENEQVYHNQVIYHNDEEVVRQILAKKDKK
ncbi:MAG: UDP-N-acetylmuramoyl-L-alanyl-D-glutamate--2,6-diaminopimelate ligase [Atribacterota bacterium]|nr:UDP-N-acetylmuramoyl-L-alanyl-D-glutamate--2,6-diaminopimelate ligase [Atribacterota bacterium]MDD5637230.1 UDP-N-acetylmuramoyl-L-alanyl-D-glutamate--2,6-diaminopimelate ligase [Atribacterota bacterium]